MPRLASVIVNKPSLHIYYAMTRRITKLSACISFRPEICIPNPEHAAHVGYPAGSICVAHCAREATVTTRKEAAAATRLNRVTLFVQQQRNIFIRFDFYFFFCTLRVGRDVAQQFGFFHDTHRLLAVFKRGRLTMSKCQERAAVRRLYGVALYNSKGNKSFKFFCCHCCFYTVITNVCVFFSCATASGVGD